MMTPPSVDDRASYDDRYSAEAKLIAAMSRIGQTSCRSYHFGPSEDHAVVAIRPDQMGAAKRVAISVLARIITWMACRASGRDGRTGHSSNGQADALTPQSMPWNASRDD